MPSAIPITITALPLYSSSHFELTAQRKKRAMYLAFSMRSTIVNTKDLPHTISVLRRHLPEVLKTQCFNEHGWSFRREASQTEIGHLFEHILLRYLCDGKLASGAQHAEYSGRTDWNWFRDPRGTFHIWINAPSSDWGLFLQAMQKSIALLERLLVTNTESTYVTNTPKAMYNEAIS